ncbi:YbaK/EbsC family protein [Carboxydocella sp. JDF658]|uniref:YbaK/EbsC family protein n=1 Tax=Carboxydocella sp. JDF658 TaxID=1926600 RepID=UPI0009AE6612|nr:YbaK/EbsC family protein [Carboxydocella sp. JDF658]GAW32348.1 hypothetical protein JDF658_21130 [Carboxydocella sp. JDF658]
MVVQTLQNPVHQRIQEFLDQFQLGIKVIEFEVSTETSELAARALGVTPAQIAKSLVFLADDQPLLVVTCGDLRVDTKKLKALTGARKIRFANPEQALHYTGHPAGGVCPFALSQPLPVYLDISMQRFPLVYAAAGTPNSAVPVTLEQLQVITGGQVVDVC